LQDLILNSHCSSVCPHLQSPKPAKSIWAVKGPEAGGEAAGNNMMKMVLTAEQLKKKHELEMKLARREVMNMQQEVDELRAHLQQQEHENKRLLAGGKGAAA